MQNRKIVLDVETTGLYPNKGHKIVEIAAIELFDEKTCGEYFHYYINPQREIPQESTNIHGIDNEKVEGCPIFKDIADELLDFVKDSKIIAHNSEFDRGFVNYELSLLSKKVYSKECFIDSLLLAKQKFPGQRVSLDELCKKFEISLESRKDYHGALIDIRLLAEVYYCLIKGQKDIFENNNHTASNSGFYKEDVYNANKSIKKTLNKVNFPLRDFSLSDEEENKHKEFLSTIKNSVWNVNK